MTSLLVKKGIYMLLEQNILARQVSIRIPNLTWAKDGQYESAIWKYDSNGKIIEDFGNHRDYWLGGSIPGLKTLKMSGNNKIQRIFSVDNEIYVFISSRENISTNTSSFVYKLNDNDDLAELFASQNPTFHVSNPLKTDEDISLRNIKITPITSPEKK